MLTLFLSLLGIALTDLSFSHSSPLARSSNYLISFLSFAEIANALTNQCNPELSALISKTLKLDKAVWLKDLTKLEGLIPFAENKAFRAEWSAIKQRNKERLAHYVQTTLGLIIRTDAMFDVQIKVSK